MSRTSFPWKAMLRALVQESHVDLKGTSTSGFNWGICLFYDSEDSHALFDYRAQLQSLTERGIIWIEREVMQRGDCMVASLCPPIIQSEDSYNAILVGSRKDWDMYLLKCLG